MAETQNPTPVAELSATVPAPAKTADELAEEAADKAKGKQDILAGVTLAIFAASLAICDLGAGKYGDDEIMINNKAAQAYSWFQSKSMKQTLVEGEGNMLKSLIDAGAVVPEKVPAIQAHIAANQKKVEKYELQKNEILKGSKGVGEKNWAQDQNGEMGKITGAEEYGTQAELLGKSGDVFDMGTLYLQLSLVMGAIGIVMSSLTQKRIFYGVMCVLGVAGSYYTYMAYQAAFLAG